MAEKPRLKETDEIFNVVGKSPSIQRPIALAQENSGERPGGDPPDPIDSIIGGPGARRVTRRGSRRARLGDAPADETASEPSDDSPLNIEKYSSDVSGRASSPDISPSPSRPPQQAEGRGAEPQPESAAPAQAGPQIRRVNPRANSTQEGRTSPGVSHTDNFSAPAAIEGPVERPENRANVPASPEGPVEQPKIQASAPASADGTEGKEIFEFRRNSPPAQEKESAVTRRAKAPASLEEGPVEPPPTVRKESAPASFEEGPVERSASSLTISAKAAPAPKPGGRGERPESPAEANLPPAPPEKPPETPEIKPFVFEKLIERSADSGGGGALKSEEPGSEWPKPPALPNTDKPPSKRQQALLEQLSSQFENAFSKAFEGEDPMGTEADPPSPIETERSRPHYSFEVPLNAPIPVDTLPEDDEAAEEADSFVKDFVLKVKAEEEDRAEQFKDTLAEKFERERKRYLKELGITPDRSPFQDGGAADSGHFVPPATRKLDIQLDPAMHRQPGEGPVTSPRRQETTPDQGVTYSRMGKARPLEDMDEAPEDEPSAFMPVKAGKKSAEQLLFELGSRAPQVPTSRSGDRPPPRISEAVRAEQLQRVLSGETKKSKDEKSSGSKPKSSLLSGSNRIIVFASAAAAVLILVLIAIPIISWLRPPETENGGESSIPGILDIAGSNTLELYETRLHQEGRGEYDNMLIKRANVSVKNASVSQNVVIADIASEGEIILEDMTVGGTIQVQGSAVESLVLRNVAADRLVIDSAGTRVSLSLAGFGSLKTLEIRSPAEVGAVSLEGAGEYSVTIGDAILRADAEVSVLDVAFNGTAVQRMSVTGDALVTLGQGTVIEQLASEGPVSLTGEGSVLKMAAGPEREGDPLVLNLGAAVSGLDLQGGADVTVAGRVDSMTAAGNLSLHGTGRISYLALNPPVSGGRLRLDVDGVGISTLIANTQARISSTGEARVNDLTANESVYALGNKVNLLVVNADGVIYENEPDKIQVMSGVRPAESMADNPNIDYDLVTTQQQSEADPLTDDFSTVCGHSRESGGFLYGDGSVSNPYQVSDAAQLAHVTAHLDSHFVQTADINIAADTRYVASFPMIASEGAPFSGSYNGMGLRIDNLRIGSSAENVGLFAENIGIIRNVNLYSGEISGTGVNSFIGGIAGLNYQNGSITGCSNGATVTGGATSYIGGITGYNYAAKIRDCYNAAMITGEANVGGIVGVNRDGATVSGSYNAGTVDGGDADTGAVAGVNMAGTITNTYYLADTALYGIGRGEGTATVKTSAEMSGSQMVADLAAGDDQSLWTAGSGFYTYPMLSAPSAGTSDNSEAAASSSQAQPPQSPPQQTPEPTPPTAPTPASEPALPQQVVESEASA